MAKPGCGMFFRASSMRQSDPYNSEGAILKQTIMKGIANQLAKATVSQNN